MIFKASNMQLITKKSINLIIYIIKAGKTPLLMPINICLIETCNRIFCIA